MIPKNLDTSSIGNILFLSFAWRTNVEVELRIFLCFFLCKIAQKEAKKNVSTRTPGYVYGLQFTDDNNNYFYTSKLNYNTPIISS